MDLAISCGLRQFISKVNNHYPQFCCFDEPFDSLDELGKSDFMKIVFEELEENKGDVFIVSHIPIHLENKPNNINIKHILVQKQNGISTAKLIGE